VIFHAEKDENIFEKKEENNSHIYFVLLLPDTILLGSINSIKGTAVIIAIDKILMIIEITIHCFEYLFFFFNISVMINCKTVFIRPCI